MKSECTWESFEIESPGSPMASGVEFPGHEPTNLGEYCELSISRSCPRGWAGRYQWVALFCSCWTWFAVSMNVYHPSFILTVPNITAPSGRVVDESICAEARFPSISKTCPEIKYEDCPPNGPNRTLWQYRDSRNSVIATFDMDICEDDPKILKSWLDTIFWACFGLGVIVGGVVSDTAGRPSAFVSGLICLTGGTLISAGSTVWRTWAGGRILQGIGDGVLGMVVPVWCAESLNKESMSLLCTSVGIGFSLGGCALAVLAGPIKPWNIYTLIVSSVAASTTIVAMVLRPPPRWLASKFRDIELHQVLQHIYSFNGQPGLLQAPPTVAISSFANPSFKLMEDRGLRVLFDSEVRVPFLVNAIIWFVVSYSYYGLSFFEPPVDLGDPTLNSCFGFVIEIPFYFVGQIAMNVPCIGRKGASIGNLFLGALLLSVFTVVDYKKGDPLTWILYYPARMCIACSFAVMYPYSFEMFPGSIRNTAVGCGSALARVSTLLSPWLSDIKNTKVQMSVVSFPCLVAAILGMLTLPETLGKSIPATLEDL